MLSVFGNVSITSFFVTYYIIIVKNNNYMDFFCKFAKHFELELSNI